MIRMLRIVTCLVGIVLMPGALLAQVSIGGQGNWGTDADWGVGGRVTLDFTDFSDGDVPFAIIGSYDWFWPDDVLGTDAQYWEINANAVFAAPAYRGVVASYAGVGLNVANFSVTSTVLGGTDESETRYGLNLVGGTKYKIGRIYPFFEGRFVIEGGEQFVITFGLEAQLTDPRR